MLKILNPTAIRLTSGQIFVIKEVEYGEEAGEDTRLTVASPCDGEVIDEPTDQWFVIPAGNLKLFLTMVEDAHEMMQKQSMMTAVVSKFRQDLEEDTGRLTELLDLTILRVNNSC